MRNLRDLDIRSFAKLASIEPLGKLTALTSVALGHCPELADLRPLAALPNLKLVKLRACPRVANLSPLRRMLKRGGKVEADERELEAQIARLRAETDF